MPCDFPLPLCRPAVGCSGNNILDSPESWRIWWDTSQWVPSWFGYLLEQIHWCNMHDLKYPQGLLLKILPVHLDPITTAAHSTIFEPATAAFRANMDQVRTLNLLPEYLIRATAQ